MGALFGDKNDLNQVFDLLEEGECMDIDMSADGEDIGMKVCRTGENVLKFDSESMDVRGTMTIRKMEDGEIEVER